MEELLRIGRNENRSTKALGQQNLTRVWSIEMKKIWLEIFTFFKLRKRRLGNSNQHFNNNNFPQGEGKLEKANNHF